MQREYFTQKKVEYTDILVDEHPEEAMKMVEFSGQMGVPFTVIDKDNGERVTVLGFDRTKIAEALALS